MTLMQVIKRLEEVAMLQPPVQTIVENDVYRLNGMPDARYGVFAFTQGRHTSSLDSTLRYFSFTLMYVDRLTEDHGNEIAVQSTGHYVLDNICRTLAEEWDISEWVIQTYTQRFMDDCAGAMCEVTFGVPNEYGGGCAELYGDTGWQKTPIVVPDEEDEVNP